MDHLHKLFYKAQFISIFTINPVDLGLVKHDDLTHDQKLQIWIFENLKEEFFWMTGIGIIEAAELIINESQSNEKIK